MATRFYPDIVNAPAVSPAYSAVWDDTSDVVRGKLVMDTNPESGYNADSSQNQSGTGPVYIGLYQYVSLPLTAISATLPVTKAVFACLEENDKLNGFLTVIVRKCDEDGSNPTDIATLVDDVEFDSGALKSRFLNGGDVANQVFSQSDRLIIEVGYYADNAKAYTYYGRILNDNTYGTDYPENDTTVGTFGDPWFETGDTFTEASGEPAAIKLGPMFAFA